MASKTQKTERVRARKRAPNKPNMKEYQKRLQKNMEVLKKTLEAKL